MDRAAFEAGLKADGFAEIAETGMPPETRRTEHTHPFEVRALILAGVLHLTCDGTEGDYAAGDMFAMPLGHPYSERTEAEGARYLVGRKPGWSRADLIRPGYSVPAGGKS